MADERLLTGGADVTPPVAAAADIAADPSTEDYANADPAHLPDAANRPTPGAPPPVRPAPGAIDS